MKRIGIFILFIMLISNISINVYAKKGDEIKAYKKFLNKEKVKYCLGEKFEDDISGFYVGYNFLDIDDDGIKELLISEQSNEQIDRIRLYVYKNKKVTQLFCYEGLNYDSEEFYNEKYNATESFIKDTKHKKSKYFFGYPMYRVKGKKDIICYYYNMGEGTYYVYYKYKDGKFYQVGTSLLENTNDEWNIKDSYLYKIYNLKNNIVKIKSKWSFLVGVYKDSKGNIIVSHTPDY